MTGAALTTGCCLVRGCNYSMTLALFFRFFLCIRFHSFLVIESPAAQLIYGLVGVSGPDR